MKYKISDDGTLSVELPVDMTMVKRVFIRDTNSRYGAVFYDDMPAEDDEGKWVLLKALYHYGSIASDKELAIIDAQMEALRSDLNYLGAKQWTPMKR